MLVGDAFGDGKYEILRQLGSGGTSTVYLAMNPKLNQQWVIKEISHSIGKIDRDRVLREARLMMEFDYPAIPRIVDIHEREDSTYIIMDYISGQSLNDVLKKKGPQPQKAVLEWAKQLCAVMEYLHSQPKPVIYHDFKPGNLILKEPENNLKLIDFGEARKMEDGDAPGGGCTSRYAAPEQQRDTRGKTDQRTDIYCFGTTLYRLLTGKLPPELPEPVGSVKKRMPNLQISNGMDNIIAKCTQLDPAKRFQSAAELRKALEHIEVWDTDYIRKQMGKIRLCSLSFGLSVLLLAGGIGGSRMAAFTNSKTYSSLVNTASDVGAEERIQNYIEAIQLDGENPKAYLKLLEAYAETSFGDEESQIFASLYNKNRPSFKMDDPDILELNYQTGSTYFNMYSGESGSLRPRLQKSMSYFEFVVENGNESYENYSIASSYFQLCKFFTDYVLNVSSTLEPTVESYQEMFGAVESCLADMQSYVSGDAASIRLMLCENLMDMISSNARGFAQTGVKQQDAMDTIDKIQESVSKEAVTQEGNIEQQERVLAMRSAVEKKVTDEYANLERGN